jgi:hypothetical protein
MHYMIYKGKLWSSRFPIGGEMNFTLIYINHNFICSSIIHYQIWYVYKILPIMAIKMIIKWWIYEHQHFASWIIRYITNTSMTLFWVKTSDTIKLLANILSTNLKIIQNSSHKSNDKRKVFCYTKLTKEIVRLHYIWIKRNSS